jgi:hypothetical protein
MNFEKPIAGLFCGLGILAAGWLLALAANNFIASKQTIVVKGLSERIVQADQANWPITFKVSGDKLSELQDVMVSNRKKVKEFLTKFGFTSDEVSDSPTSVVDNYAQNYGEQPRYHYLVSATVLLRTNKIDQIMKAMGETGQLINQGIVIDIPQYSPAGEFLYTQLNSIKPEMLKEATQNARKAAEQFAKDSSAEIGSIKSAQQGLFTVADRDSVSPYWKSIRVVSTVEFFIKK